MLRLFTQQIRAIHSNSRRNKTAVWSGTHKLPNTDHQRIRSTQSRKPFALGRDNITPSYQPTAIPSDALMSNAEALEYKVWRTQFGSLPVYTEYKSGRSNVLTIIRRTEGDLQVKYSYIDDMSIR